MKTNEKEVKICRKKEKGFILTGLMLVMFGCICVVMGQQRNPNGSYQTTGIFEDDGDTIRPFAASIGTTTAVQIYYSTQTANPRTGSYLSPDRMILIQNPNAYNLWCSTVSNVSATSGNRWVVFASTSVNGGSGYFAPPPGQIWCVYESAAGAGTNPVVGYVGFDSKD